MAETGHEDDTRSDEELIEDFLLGDRDAFAHLVVRYEKKLFVFLSRFTGDSGIAEDVFQEAFLQVYKSAGAFDTSRVFRPWLYTIAVNKARDIMRRRASRTPVLSLDAPAGDEGDACTVSVSGLLPSNIPGPEEISSNREVVSSVHKVVNDMNTIYRAVLLLSYFETLPHREVAEILGIPVGTVKSRLHAAIRDFAGRWTVAADAEASNDG